MTYTTCWLPWKARTACAWRRPTVTCRCSLVGAITKDCERPDIAMKWLDFWFSNEGMVMIDYGIEGVNWEWRDEPAINGNVPSRFFLTSRNVLQNTTWYVGTVPYYAPRNPCSAARRPTTCPTCTRVPLPMRTTTT